MNFNRMTDEDRDLLARLPNFSANKLQHHMQALQNEVKRRKAVDDFTEAMRAEVLDAITARLWIYDLEPPAREMAEIMRHVDELCATVTKNADLE